jgi:beta-lactamase superfamily II metal-dependent hydrolase
MFCIELLPAEYGDCLWIEYGDPKAPSRVLIDGGTTKTYPRLKQRMERVPAKDRDFDLFVLTHIDADHIGGAIPFFKDQNLAVRFKDIWFNGWKHLPRGFLAAKQAEIFSTIVRDRKLPWNASFDEGPIMLDKGKLPTKTLRGGMKLTLLSPTRKKLAKLRPVWEKELRRHGLTPGSKRDFRKFLAGAKSRSTDVDALADSKFSKDVGIPNGASIAFLAEFEDTSALLVGDAHSPLLTTSVERLLKERGEERLAIDAFTLSHHASKYNLSNDLLHLLDCRRFLVSTSGARFNHPDREAVARAIKYGGAKPEICFNYRSSDNKVWAREDLKERYGYEAFYPEKGLEGIRVSL